MDRPRRVARLPSRYLEEETLPIHDTPRRTHVRSASESSSTPMRWNIFNRGENMEDIVTSGTNEVSRDEAGSGDASNDNIKDNTNTVLTSSTQRRATVFRDTRTLDPLADTLADGQRADMLDLHPAWNDKGKRRDRMAPPPKCLRRGTQWSELSYSMHLIIINDFLFNSTFDEVCKILGLLNHDVRRVIALLEQEYNREQIEDAKIAAYNEQELAILLHTPNGNMSAQLEMLSTLREHDLLTNLTPPVLLSITARDVENAKAFLRGRGLEEHDIKLENYHGTQRSEEMTLRDSLPYVFAALSRLKADSEGRSSIRLASNTAAEALHPQPRKRGRPSKKLMANEDRQGVRDSSAITTASRHPETTAPNIAMKHKKSVITVRKTKPMSSRSQKRSKSEMRGPGQDLGPSKLRQSMTMARSPPGPPTPHLNMQHPSDTPDVSLKPQDSTKSGFAGPANAGMSNVKKNSFSMAKVRMKVPTNTIRQEGQVRGELQARLALKIPVSAAKQDLPSTERSLEIRTCGVMKEPGSFMRDLDKRVFPLSPAHTEMPEPEESSYPQETYRSRCAATDRPHMRSEQERSRNQVLWQDRDPTGDIYTESLSNVAPHHANASCKESGYKIKHTTYAIQGLRNVDGKSQRLANVLEDFTKHGFEPVATSVPNYHILHSTDRDSARGRMAKTSQRVDIIGNTLICHGPPQSAKFNDKSSPALQESILKKRKESSMSDITVPAIVKQVRKKRGPYKKKNKTGLNEEDALEGGQLEPMVKCDASDTMDANAS